MKTHRSIAFILAFATGIPGAAPPIAPKEIQFPAREWFNRPWIYRYILFVDSVSGAQESMRLAKRINMLAEQGGKDNVYLDGDALLTSPIVLVAPGATPLALNLVTFDNKGHVTGRDTFLSQLTGKITIINRLVLVREDAIGEKPFYLAEWSQGIPGDVSFSPALCTILDSHRYGNRWKSGRARGDFGCREWTAQLYRWEQPYIDVTTYTRHGNFIGEFLGWSRFEDAPKPVIGMHGKHWLCLHECPAGEMPGVIDDLRAWTRKHNFPMPVRPKSQPEYPDSHYQDDLNEFGD